MARKASGFFPGEISELRTKSGVIAADSATLTDANIAPTLAINCTGLDTILVGVEITAGSSPTMTIEALFRDENAADGARWKRINVGLAIEGVPAAETTGALDGTKLVELAVYGAKQVYLRVTAVANSTNTTAYKILGMAGRTRPGFSQAR